MESYQIFLEAFTLFVPFLVASTCTLLIGFSRRDCLTREEWRLKNIVVVYFSMLGLSWFAMFCYYFFSEGLVILNVPCFAAFLLSVVFLYRIIRFLTRLGLPEDFPVVHYITPCVIAVAFMVWSFFVPFDVQVEIILSRQLVIPGEYAVFSRFFTSKPALRLFFVIIYFILTCLLLVRYYRKASATDCLMRKPARWVVFLIMLMLISMLSSMVGTFSLREKLFTRLWILIASLCASGKYVLLTYHIIRRKYLLYVVRPAVATGKRSMSKSGHRVFTGELTHERLENWFREEKPYLNSDLKIADVVEAMNVNRSVISSFINKKYGLNFNQFVNRWRLKEIERLAKLSGADVTRLYAKAGFSELRQYYRARKAAGNSG
jgi:AraC-like DNA-binding protein